MLSSTGDCFNYIDNYDNCIDSSLNSVMLSTVGCKVQVQEKTKFADQKIEDKELFKFIKATEEISTTYARDLALSLTCTLDH